VIDGAVTELALTVTLTVFDGTLSWPEEFTAVT